ncbi:MAG: hypothetical protein B7X06_04445 [Verrucomicrobia bacterium 21-51-4]|nr:MAG: hypothetical protein B7X06_04445 [Verrucomicrobia bacterium 21-51-4]
MPTSGTTTFSVSANDIINGAFRLTGAFGASDVIPAADTANALQALNIMVKSWQTMGYELWTVKELVLPMVASTTSYQIGPTATGTGALVTDRPLRISQAFLRNDSQNTDTMLSILSRQEYEQLGAKSTLGVVNSIFYDPQLNNGVLYVYTTPSDASRSVHLFVQRPIQDFNATTDLPDFPQEWFQALKWGLASEIGMEYGVPPEVMNRIDARALAYSKEMSAWSQEEASMYFTMDMRYQGNRS